MSDYDSYSGHGHGPRQGKLSVEDVLLQSIRALEAALDRARQVTEGPLARFAELPPFLPADIQGNRITRHRTRAVLRCSCGWESSSVNQAGIHAYYQPFNDRKVHVIEGQWIHSFQMTMRRRNWWNA